MSWTQARAALDTRMAALPSLGTAKIGWPNVTIPAQTSLYYLIAFLPSAVNPELQGADHEQGIYQVSVFVPAGSGLGPGMVAAQAVCDWFKRQVISGVSCGVPVLAPYLQEADWLHIPVSIPFQVL
jgi:hypothetical protein